MPHASRKYSKQSVNRVEISDALAIERYRIKYAKCVEISDILAIKRYRIKSADYAEISASKDIAKSALNALSPID